jgi:hypothetical protein
MKNAIIILSDPKSDSDEATTRLLNALAFADECKRSGDELEIAFVGTGTRWPERLIDLSHPANARYNAVREHVVGASRSCAMRNNAVAGVESAGLPLIDDNKVEGTAGVLSIRRYYADGWNVSLF